MLIAIKYNEDDYYSNSFYAKVAGITLNEVNSIEMEFLKLINFSLYVHDDAYNKYSEYLRRYRIKEMM